jgi:hypothetical protein
MIYLRLSANDHLFKFGIGLRWMHFDGQNENLPTSCFNCLLRIFRVQPAQKLVLQVRQVRLLADS